ncbi:helicase domain protein [Geminocystis sp. NIES-3708]|uniref:type ISP restriction/modification enzyme n=1 Tax=Geminocystis sp. NIES-3708 TaxID=1615909 RepID=UPI0005FC5EDC|nr:type ISP restriction/modification enzyme [Geminocystis sp. NIES-3708]BAQ59695.1 helicase domain protein [Geminocystis sp. NIES-3708]
MSRILIKQYRQELERIIRYGGSRNEGAVRRAMGSLLNGYCKPRNFVLVEELTIISPLKNNIRLDGIVKDALRLDWGYWEAKDEKDSLDAEIEAKFKKGYPTDNILFEDTKTAVLIQNGDESLRINMENDDDLDKLINQFLDYERTEIKDFRQAINTFSQDLPTILDTLRNLIDSQSPSPLTPLPQGEGNKAFIEARDKFLKVCQESINPDIKIADIREMIIQHILTEDIFTNIFSDAQFHQENNIAKQLNEVIKTFFTGNVKRNTFKTIQSYYNVIIRTASNIVNHQEKQKFLKVVYENFYKAYNPKEADRLGIVYTPNEIVKFMVQSTDYLLEKHFNKTLGNKGVEILDPCTGTGTFITEILDYLLTRDVEYKYKNEIHCNEISILPYYIANLNIEYSYQQKIGEYLEFNNICLVDTLDHTNFGGKQFDLFSMSQENTERIKRQNESKISVIIGNPPYNANQQNENDNNKNRSYDAIDKRIKETYVKESTAQKTKLYDMYSRFLRWGTDRLDNDGIIAFVSNSSFIDAKTYDGFRKLIVEDFNEIYIIDLKGNARNSGERRRQEGGNIFDDQIKVGIAVYFLVRNSKLKGCKVYYNAVDDYKKAEDKLKFLSANNLESINFETINPDKNNNWINLADDNDFNTLLPLVNKETKLSKNKDDEKAVFKLFSNGVNTARDEWVFDYNVNNLSEKIKYFIDKYNLVVNQFDNKKIDDILDAPIKWSADLKKSLLRNCIINFNDEKVVEYNYRPFIKNYYYSEQLLSDRLTSNHYEMFGIDLNKNNLLIIISNPNLSKKFSILSCINLADFHLVGDTQCLPLYRYEKGERIDNITDWGLEQFRDNYGDKKIEKEDIFNYVYGVLHNPEYRQKYELNLKREFPRIPFYDDFWQWSKWGKQLMELHLNYETIKPYKLTRIDIPLNNPEATPKPKLKADKTNHKIILDEVTTLEKIPSEAWEYKLGNRSALEWILDQYKEKKPKDKTIAEKFNNYRFADYKEQVIELLMRVTTVSIETMKIINQTNKYKKTKNNTNFE